MNDPHSTAFVLPRRSLMWFASALLPMVVAQVLRLQQQEPIAWLACDYAGRLAIILVLAAIPATRAVAFARVPSRMDAGLAAIWIIVLALIYFFGIRFAQTVFAYLYPLPRLEAYPGITGVLRWFDLTAGLLLVAYSEELLFRRMARAVLAPSLGDGWVMAMVAAALFGLFHWPGGLWTMAGAALTGLMMMRLYQRSLALWPVVTLHYLIDLIVFV